MAPRCSTRAIKKRWQFVPVIIPVVWQEAVARPLTRADFRGSVIPRYICLCGRERLMLKKTGLTLVVTLLAAVNPAAAHQQNLVLFVPDGLRAASVTRANAPTFAHVRTLWA